VEAACLVKRLRIKPSGAVQCALKRSNVGEASRSEGIAAEKAGKMEIVVKVDTFHTARCAGMRF
jgi:hypothetical protein